MAVEQTADPNPSPAAGQASRGWTDQQWAAAAARLRARGLLADSPGLALTAAGQQLRDEVEAMTNRLAMAPWRQLGDEGTEELRHIMTDLSWQVVDGGGIDQRAFLLPRTPQDPAERAA